jgi:hypothetical protein
MDSVVKSVKLPKALAAALSRAAEARECSESDLIRQGIQHVLDADEGIDMAEVIGPDIGVARGPRDLSSSRRRLSGYGRSRRR